MLTDQPGIHERRPAVPTDNHDSRKQHEQPAENIDPRLRTRRELSRYDVDAYVVVALERPGGDEEEHGGIEVPLYLEPRVRAHVEDISEYISHRSNVHGDTC